jgi:hypothetical protein
VVVDAIMNTPLQSLGGVAMSKIINWTPRRQAKVNILVETLMDGKADVPTDKGDFFATYVAAAATLAYWGLVRNGTFPEHAAELVETNALKMLDTVRQRIEAKGQSVPPVALQPSAIVPGPGPELKRQPRRPAGGSDKPAADKDTAPKGDGSKS